MNIILRLIAPAVLLGAVLLIGERPANTPLEVPSAELSAAPEGIFFSLGPCLGLLAGLRAVSLMAVRLPPSAAALLETGEVFPEQRSLSPPCAA